MMNERPNPVPQAIPKAIPQPMSTPERHRIEHDPTEENGVSQKTTSTWAEIAIGALAALLAIAIGGGVFFWISARSDRPTQEQVEEIQRNWDVVLKTGVTLPAVKQEEMTQALATTNLSEQDRIALVKEVEAERVSLVWITVWDCMAEDGDVISLSSNGFTVTIPLYLKMQPIAIPKPSDGIVRVTGVQDGGGGITLGLMSGPNPVWLPFLAIGQRIDIPVR